MIKFNIPPYVDGIDKTLKEVIKNHKICGDGPFTKKCNEWLELRFHAKKVLLTTSGSSALDMAAMLCDLKPGDEVILPSYTFSSTANSFVLAGAKLVFVDIKPDTMNINENMIEAAVTEKTKVICVVHYAGVSCDMDSIIRIAKKYKLLVVEDAAQGVMSKYKDKYLGTIGDIGCYSFHETKNYSMGEGGAIVINNPIFLERSEIIREKGTNRSRFLLGQVDKYTWVDKGDSYLPSELNAAYLWPQLLCAEEINAFRLKCWNHYFNSFKKLRDSGCVELPFIPDNCLHNAHMFYLKVKDLEVRTKLISYLKEHEIQAVFHYIPLHSAPAGLKYGVFVGKDVFTTKESERLVRLPLYFGLKEEDQDRVIRTVYDFFTMNNGSK